MGEVNCESVKAGFLGVGKKVVWKGLRVYSKQQRDEKGSATGLVLTSDSAHSNGGIGPYRRLYRGEGCF